MKKLFVFGAIAAVAVAAAAIITKKRRDEAICSDDDFHSDGCDLCCGDFDDADEIPAEKADEEPPAADCCCSEEELLDKVEDKVESDEV